MSDGYGRGPLPWMGQGEKPIELSLEDVFFLVEWGLADYEENLKLVSEEDRKRHKDLKIAAKGLLKAKVEKRKVILK